MSKNEKSWLGTPLSDMYKGQGPWCFATAPVSPSRYHQVLYQLPVSLRNPPKPHYNLEPKHWDDDHVRMPYSSQSFYLTKESGEEIIRPRWEVICETLSKPIKSVEDLERAIGTYTNNKITKFPALRRLFNENVEPDEAEHFFENILPEIIKLALRLPELLPGSLPLLKKEHCKSVSLSQLQIASLLANGFLCTFLWRKDSGSTYPGANFFRLFTADQRPKRQNCVIEKLKCVIHYFRRVITKNPVGVVTFERKFVPKNQIPRWDLLDNMLRSTRIHINSSGVIEDGLGFLQVDFANKFIGGGVLGYGCVQEEIRFVICPELIVSRLFIEELSDNEAIEITGLETYSTYSGYSDSFKWEGNVNDITPFDDYGRRRTSVLVIDAIRFNKSKDQFNSSAILRELNKAYVGFNSREKNNLAPVATGNWGCGAFKGDPYLKSLIQLIACNAANRDLVYYSFGNEQLRNQFYNMYLFLVDNNVTINQLWRYMCRFCASNLTEDKLYSFIQQCHFDLKSQPSLRQFCCFNMKKDRIYTVTPSTSTSNTEQNKIKKEETSVKIEESGNSHNNEGSNKISTTSTKANISAYNKKNANSNDVIKLIDVIDGSHNKPSHNFHSGNSTLLSEIDKMKGIKTCNSEQIANLQHERSTESVEIPIKVDLIEKNVQPITTSFTEEKKRKITDYFSKVTNQVNNYL